MNWKPYMNTIHYYCADEISEWLNENYHFTYTELSSFFGEYLNSGSPTVFNEDERPFKEEMYEDDKSYEIYSCVLKHFNWNGQERPEVWIW